MRRPLRVLVGSPKPPVDGNPYLSQLTDELRERCEVRYFSWKNALIWRYDVLHLHWPETLFRGGSALKSIVKSGLALLLTVRLVIRRTAVVQTVHNSRPHEPSNAMERRGLARLRRCTTAEIHLVPMVGSDPSQQISRVIPHGHYRSAYASIEALGRPTGKVLFFGRIRPYKGVEGLLRAFETVQEPGLELEIAGEPIDESLRHRITELATRNRRVSLDLTRLSNRDLEMALERSTLVVLPFEEFLNSGSALLALSLGRPVLMPSSPAADLLRGECGAAWVHTFENALEASDIEQAYRAVVASLPLELPVFEGREWDDIADRHVSIYEAVSGA